MCPGQPPRDSTCADGLLCRLKNWRRRHGSLFKRTKTLVRRASFRPRRGSRPRTAVWSVVTEFGLLTFQGSSWTPTTRWHAILPRHTPAVLQATGHRGCHFLEGIGIRSHSFVPRTPSHVLLGSTTDHAIFLMTRAVFRQNSEPSLMRACICCLYCIGIGIGIRTVLASSRFFVELTLKGRRSASRLKSQRGRPCDASPSRILQD